MIKVTGLHPLIVEALKSIITESKARGLNVGIYSTIRVPEEQERLYALGRSVINQDGLSPKRPMGNTVTNARAWESWHFYGLAVDIVFKNEKGWTWNKSHTEWEELGKVGEIFGMEWGGRWKMKDYPHFQKRGNIKSTIQAKEILFTQGLDKLWEMV